ncbi:response regulator transcription factor [Chryseobacterium koreense]|uniref:LuxR family transcriptional regulator n=1 Tax=Chryseobacterium koreense CCUG 49689 TaxID=1304281 RepID=A0A0J7LNN5_9FLAO|nr:response regulator transcription factor [Chryseobacterium koreense]KMQ70685.1 LuxR family transcriptional regulator [Chryseobacterium koreense CCUG 49689]MBB5334535.1 DNA-binding NarL/FixJ family response regulator [Chryseobacterium koreense]
MPIKIAIVEDDRHYNNALKKIVDFDEELLCVQQFFEGRVAMRELAFCKPDVVLIDIKLPDISGTDIVHKLSAEMEKTQFIMCTSFEDEENIFKSLKSGASGYLVKGDSMGKIINAVKEVHNGGAPMSFSVAKKVLQFFREEKRNNETTILTQTEKEVLEMLAQGLLYKEIADKKCIALDTVKKHIGSIYRKLQVSNKIEAINKLSQPFK